MSLQARVSPSVQVEIFECRCDERLKTEVEESTRLVYTGLIGELEHLKVKTRFIDGKFTSVMDEHVFLK